MDGLQIVLAGAFRTFHIPNQRCISPCMDSDARRRLQGVTLVSNHTAHQQKPKGEYVCVIVGERMCYTVIVGERNATALYTANINAGSNQTFVQLTTAVLADELRPLLQPAC
eukprot:4240387-Amphidinium_carterae.1